MSVPTVFVNEDGFPQMSRCNECNKFNRRLTAPDAVKTTIGTDGKTYITPKVNECCNMTLLERVLSQSMLNGRYTGMTTSSRSNISGKHLPEQGEDSNPLRKAIGIWSGSITPCG